jgi:uncharacterized protein YciI
MVLTPIEGMGTVSPAKSNMQQLYSEPPQSPSEVAQNTTAIQRPSCCAHQGLSQKINPFITKPKPYSSQEARQPEATREHLRQMDRQGVLRTFEPFASLRQEPSAGVCEDELERSCKRFANR